MREICLVGIGVGWGNSKKRGGYVIIKLEKFVDVGVNFIERFFWVRWIFCFVNYKNDIKILIIKF